MSQTAPFAPALWKRHTGVLPGFSLALGLTGGHLGLLVIAPLAVLGIHAGTSLDAFSSILTTERLWKACALSVTCSLTAAFINLCVGLLLAWVLARYRFPLKGLVDALVDVPFALPTAVAGIALTAMVMDDQWLGAWLKSAGIQVAFTRVGVLLALTFVGLPFVVRTVQPVLMSLDPHVEEAAATLGATPWQTFTRVLLPALASPLLTGFSLAFARALGEYGSVVFISGNIPLQTEIVPFLIVTKLEQYDYAGATAVAVVMLTTAAAIMGMLNLWDQRLQRRGGAFA
jgi:sulfate transport system permease protein